MQCGMIDLDYRQIVLQLMCVAICRDVMDGKDDSWTSAAPTFMYVEMTADLYDFS